MMCPVVDPAVHVFVATRGRGRAACCLERRSEHTRSGLSAASHVFMGKVSSFTNPLSLHGSCMPQLIFTSSYAFSL